MKIATIKKLISFILAFILSIASFSSTVAFASVSFPKITASAYCEFQATKDIPVYRNSACTIRGTSNPATSYAAEIFEGDICRIIKLTANYIQLKYPTSTGMKTGYIKRSSLISVTAPCEILPSSKASVTTYVNTNGKVSGYTELGDVVYNLGKAGNYTTIIYTAKSGTRAWKLAYVKTSDYLRIKGSSSSATTSTTLKTYTDALCTSPVSSLQFHYSYSADTTLYVSSNTNWTVTSNKSWITIKNGTGTRNGSFIISISRNNNTSQTRTGTVTIKAGAVTKNITITQQPPPIIVIPSWCTHTNTTKKYLSFLVNDTSSDMYWVGAWICTDCGYVTQYSYMPLPNS